jgi:AraC-like DNA-binding protein
MTTPTGPVRRIGYATADPAEAREFLTQMYGADVRVAAPPGSSWEMAFALADAGDFSRADMKLPAELRYTLHGRDDVVIGTAIGGTVEMERGQATSRYRAGDVYIGNQPRTDWAGTSRNGRVHMVTLPASLLAEGAGRPADGQFARWEFQACEPVAGGAELWRKATRFVDDLLACPGSAASPLLVQAAGRLLVATALSIFPNTAVTAATTADSRDARPATLRRAVTFIHENARDDISLADIAKAARVSARAVQLTFRRHLDITPTEYLRRVRLEGAHRELQAASPAEETVTDVAYRWGFASPSRFTARYRDTYGVLPSQTLRGEG